MSQGHYPEKILILFLIFFAASMVVENRGHAQEVDTTDPSLVKVTVEPAGQGEWKIINHEGVAVGTLVSSELKSFKLYDASGIFMGTILESKEWFHRLYRKRDTRIAPAEARLYIQALKAIDLIKQ